MGSLHGTGSRILLEYRNLGYQGEVYVHTRRGQTMIYFGSIAQEVYDALKKFAQERREGSGEWYEQQTNSGMQWREKS